MEGVNSRKKRKVHLSEFYRFRLLFEIRYTHTSAERHDSVRMLRVRNLMCKCNLTVSSTLNLAALSLAITLTFLRNPSFHICSSEHWSRLASSVLGCCAHSEMEVYSPYIPDASTIYTWPYHPVWGKTNKNGHRVFTGVIPHINPLLCPIFALALFLLFRFLVNGEKFPEFNDVKSFFHRVLLCKTSNAAEV